MTVGDKIRKIRTFRGMTQKELGVAIGLEEKGADNRVAQYETNYRVPKKDLLTFFWLDEDSPGSIRLFQLVRNPGKERNGDDTIAKYNDSDEWPVSQPVGMYFQYGLVDEFMQEWLLRQQELHAGQITREEYFEWKLNWPHTCDDSKERKEYIPWKKK